MDKYDPIREGQLALERALPVFAKQGVKLDLPPHVPKYHADSEGRIVQILNGVTSFVEVVDGKIVEMKTNVERCEDLSQGLRKLEANKK